MKRLTVLSARLIAKGIAFILFAITVVPGIGLAQQAEPKAPLLDGLSGAQRASAERGRRLFELRFLPIPAEGLPGGGLGPLYIRNACASCHVGSGRGTLPEARDGSLIGGVVYTAKPHLSYGTEIHPRSVPPVPHEGDIAVAWDVGDGAFLDEEPFSLRQPKLALEQANYGSPPPALSLRMAPSLLGLGLLQSVPDVEILAWADPQDVNGDGISGRPNIVDDPVSGRRAVGRFGWKADRNSLISTVTTQAARFMGLTSTAHPDEPCAPTQLDCASYAIGGRADLPDGVLRDLTAYVEALQQPVRKNTDDPLVLRGLELFRQANCTACHRERLTTAAAVPGAAYLSGWEFYAYTDLLLHDMGDELDDGQQSGRAATWEWRTPPLWGLDRPAQRGTDFGYLHDGRARSLTEAILWHGGEALASRNAFFVLPKEDRDALIAFLKSL